MSSHCLTRSIISAPMASISFAAVSYSRTTQLADLRDPLAMLYIGGHGHERRTHPWRREIGRPRLAPLPKFLLDVAFKIFDVKNWRWNLLHHHFIPFGIRNYKAT